MTWSILDGDALTVLRTLEAGSVQTCVTSPPYFGLRDYGDTGQLGLEPTPEEYVARLVEVFREVRRVLRDDGTLWLNLGDSYVANSHGQGNDDSGTTTLRDNAAQARQRGDKQKRLRAGEGKNEAARRAGYKPKDLLGIPWMVAFALRADGWYLRSDIIWAKPNPMPESVTDRPTKAHEYVFLLSKSPRYFWDADAVREEATEVGIAREGRARDTPAHSPPGTQPNRRSTSNGDADWLSAGRNKRSVWTVATQPFPGAHFAVFPPKLIEPCVLAGTSEAACGGCGAPYERRVERKRGASWHSHEADAEVGQRQVKMGQASWDEYEPPRTTGWWSTCTHLVAPSSCVVLDPFSGAGTTGLVATRLDRSYIGIELNPAYAEMSRERIRDDQPLMNYLTEQA